MSFVYSTAYLFEALLIGLLVSSGMAVAAIVVAKKIHLLDEPGSAPHKIHKEPIPIAGGIALAGSLILLAVLLGVWQTPKLPGVLAAAGIIFAAALWDDLYDLKPRYKLAAQIVAAIVVVVSGTYVKIFEANSFFFQGPQSLRLVLDLVVTLVWMVGITNAFNLVDSADGLASGLAAWAFAFFMLATHDAGQINLAIASAMLLGISLALCFFNAAPARLFLGDSGAQTLGFLLAAIAILYNPPERLQTNTWFMPIMLLGIPIFDTTLVFFSRLRCGKPFYRAGLDHTYHRLVRLGFSPSRAVMAMHFAALALQCAAFIAVSLPPLWANLIFLVVLLAGAGCFYFLDRPQCRPDVVSHEPLHQS